MPKRIRNLEAPFQGLRNASYLTGLSISAIRCGCKDGTIPHIMCGKEYRVNMPVWLAQLNGECANCRKEV